MAFASLWVSGDGAEIAVDLMRFGADAPRGAMDFLFVELLLWGRRQGYAAFEFGSWHGGGTAGGVKLLQKTVQNLTGITFQGALIVNFDNFSSIVTKLGGIDMYVDETTTSIHHGYLISDPKKTAAPYKIDKNTGVPICSIWP